MGRRIRTLYIAGLFIFTAIIFVTLTTCDPMDIRGMIEELVGGSGEVEIDTVPPNVDAGTYPEYYANGSPLFGGASDPNGGTIASTWSEVTEFGIIFGDANALDSTITYDGWENGAVVVEVTLNLHVTDGTNEVNAEVTITLYNTDYVYVTTTGTNDGSAPDAPRGSDINAAIAWASANGRSAVAIAEGTYSGDTANSTLYTMVEGVSLYGAYSATDWVRDLSGNTTTLQDTSTAGGTVIEFPSGTTGNTIIDGFTILSGTTSGAFYCIKVNNGATSPVIQNNAIICITSTAGPNYGIHIGNSTPVIRNNTINAGDVTSGSSYGIYCVGTSAASPIIRNNTIDGGDQAAASGYGIYLYTLSNPVIENNIIFTSSGAGRGIYENSIDTTNPSSVKNNDVYGAATLYYDNAGNGIFTSTYNGNFDDDGASGGAELTSPIGTGNANTDPNLGGSDGMHLTGTTPSAVKTGGLDGAANSWGFTTDKDGNPRTGNGTTGWSMGAYELD